MVDYSHRSAQVHEGAPAVMYKGLVYIASCCHRCAMEMAAFSCDERLEELSEDEFILGYELENGEFQRI